MNEFLSVIAQGWYGLAFAAVVIVIGVLSNAGVMRTEVHRSRPASAWGAIFCMAPFVILIVSVALVRALATTFGLSFSWIMYTAIVVSFSLASFGIYLVLTRRPPRPLVPRWMQRA